MTPTASPTPSPVPDPLRPVGVLPAARPEDVESIRQQAAAPAAPPDHAAALQFMRQRPGTPYLDALAVARGEVVGSDPGQAPWYHEPAVARMLGSPGLSYEAAAATVVAEGGCR